MKKWSAFFTIAMLFKNGTPIHASAPADESIFFMEIDEVITASRRPQSIDDAPVAVEVITPEDIKASGVFNIWDLLRFRAGMNVLEGRSIEGNRAIVSVRGFPGEFTGNLQVLVDGRSTYQALTSGTYWQQIPVQMQDLERIEIVRGPNAALYGSNAGLGVINFITKKPRGETAASVGTIGGNFGTVLGFGTVESAVKNFDFRISHTFRQNEGFPLVSSKAEANDFLHMNKSNFRGTWAASDRTMVEVFSGAAWTTSGVPPTTTEQTQFVQDFQMAKLAHMLAGSGAIEAVVSRNHYISEQSPSVPDVDSVSVLQYDAELMHRFGWGNERMYTASGVSYRWASARSSTFFPGKGAVLNEVGRLFVNQTMKVTDPLSLVGAASVEETTLDGTLFAYQAAALYRLTRNHGLRASYSLAPTLPALYDHYAYHNYSNTPPIRVVGNANMRAQQLSSYELGYRGKIRDLNVETSVFYMIIRDFKSKSFTFFPPPIQLTFDNRDEAIARGAELSLRYAFKAGRSVYVNYTYEHITSALRTPTVLKGTPAHMANAGGMTPIGGGFSFSANLGYKNAYTIVSDSRAPLTVDAHAHTRVDARLGYIPRTRREFEAFVSCQNITDAGHVEFADGLEVPRTYLTGVSYKFL